MTINHRVDTIMRRGRVVIPSGWRVPVFEVQPEDAAFSALVPAYMQQGMTERRAVKKVLDVVQRDYMFGYLHGLRMSVGGQALRYAKLYPELVNEDGTLVGFDPQKVASYYLPYAKPTGQAGLGYVLREMAETVR
jgi:hypothetical protein